ncbi:hypothetical protein [Halostagnicola sp. A56]|uniref:hypothetical protein n=1 Tax=Halostagnicola sp. A56 TaxID=1495067 RepID=UPI0012E2FB17|nr:hypothetical protein [Halostagnicola sp. A56]
MAYEPDENETPLGDFTDSMLDVDYASRGTQFIHEYCEDAYTLVTNGVSIGDIEINEVVLVITVPDENKPREILDGWISEQDDLTAIPDVEGHLDW